MNSLQLHGMQLFSGIQEEDLHPMLNCLGSYTRTYQKGELISLSGKQFRYVGILLQGTIHMIKEDVWGHKTILAFIKEEELFGETFACGSDTTATVAFYAATSCSILFLPFHKIIHTCNRSCIFHHRLIENMVRLIANKNQQLMEKVEITSQKTLREKILAYLSLQMQLHESDCFEIPIGRLELADYLCADRSALTRELSNMKKEGLIDFNKNKFYIKIKTV